MSQTSRRDFLKRSGALLAAGTLPLSVVELAFGKDDPQSFTFAFISDSHITHVKGNQFVNNWDRGLKRAVAEANLLEPRPDFIFYGGDTAQLGKPEEIDHGLEILGGLRGRVHTSWVNTITTSTWVSTGATGLAPTTTASATRAFISSS